MSAVHIVDLNCDAAEWFGDTIACHNHPAHDRWTYGLAKLRHFARQQGWTVRRRGGRSYDLCELCSAEASGKDAR